MYTEKMLKNFFVFERSSQLPSLRNASFFIFIQLFLYFIIFFSITYKFLMLQAKSIEIFDIDCVFECLSDKGGIFISNYQAAANPSLLKQYKIGAIISIARNGFIYDRDKSLAYLYIPAKDSQQYTIAKHFQQTFDFIDKNRKETNVLVHCAAGISRSATIVAAYLLKKYKYSLEKVLSLLRRRRPKIKPNRGFLQQLKKYCCEIGIKTQQHNLTDSKTTYSSCLLTKKTRDSFQKRSLSKKMTRFMKKREDDETTQSIEKQRRQQRQITEKLESLRSKVLKASRINRIKSSRKNSSILMVHEELKNSTFSSTLPSSEVSDSRWKLRKSVNLE